MMITEKPEIETEITESNGGESQERKNFAAMNGVKDLRINIESSDEEIAKEIPEPEEVVTTRTVSQNPLLKVIVIGGVILMFVMLIGGVINGSMNALKLSTTKIEPKQNVQEVEKQLAIDETGKDKTALALTSQSSDFKKVRDLKAVPETTPTPTPNQTPVAVSTTPTTPVPVRRQVLSRQTPPVRQSQPLPVQRQALPVQRQPRPQIQALSHKNATTTVKATKVEPMEQWLAVANVGSFGANTVELPAEKLESAEEIKGGIGKPKLDKQIPKNQEENTNYGQARVLVGTRAEGKLETPIVWSNNTENQSLSYLIRLTKPLKTSTGSEVLPKDSYIVVQMKGASQSEYIQLQAVAALVNNNGETEEKSIPEGTVLILAKNGKLLKAESRQGGDLGETLFSAVLSGVTKAAEIQNRPNSQVTTNSNGFSSSTISNENKDVLAGFTEGTISEIVRGIQTKNQQRVEQLQSADKVFVIEAGKQVQIFVNQTINL
ncbi:hypothetical protein [Anabaena sp. UHCC 0399]|uniref:hypothetical protein n=1 Tax=Anabaena sp. UHCC 0399 TaxID=3110238 RepID=UPI002B1E9E4B|nr:hypothetical protein [Anabaena sp. UHCC 0399]MEA5566638.1 hypothetical protein [Anabaena sp. UHCC 0399]